MPLLRRHQRGLVRDYILDAMERNPSATKEEIEQEVRGSLEEEFGAMPAWLTMLIKILMELLPLLFSAKGRSTD